MFDLIDFLYHDFHRDNTYRQDVEMEFNFFWWVLVAAIVLIVAYTLVNPSWIGTLQVR